MAQSRESQETACECYLTVKTHSDGCWVEVDGLDCYSLINLLQCTEPYELEFVWFDGMT